MENNKNLERQKISNQLSSIEVERLLDYIIKNHGEIQNRSLCKSQLMMGIEFLSNRFSCITIQYDDNEFTMKHMLSGANTVMLVLIELSGIKNNGEVTDEHIVELLRRYFDILGETVFNQ